MDECEPLVAGAFGEFQSDAMDSLVQFFGSKTLVGTFVAGLGYSFPRVQEYRRFGPNPTLHRIVRIFEPV